MAAAAALARIEEVRSQMTTHQATREEAASVARTIWALGDYHRFAKELFWELGPVLVEATGISQGDRVLDVAAGTGNVSIRAAERGAEVVALDITPESLAAGSNEAESLGLSIDWVEGDAQELPFEDASFDVITSSAGAMFAPDHQAVGDEMLRVCRPGGTIGLITFVNEGVTAAFFALLGEYAPPPAPGELSPILWGDQGYVRGLLGDRVSSLAFERRLYVERLSGESRTPEAYLDFYKKTFGPIVAVFGSLADEPERAAALDREALELVTTWNSGTPEAAEYHYDYLLTVARKRS